MMRIKTFTNPREFVDFAKPMLMREEAANCFFLGSVAALTDIVTLCAICDGEEPVAAAVMTPTRHMLMTTASKTAIEALIEFLLAEKITVPGIQGRRGDAEVFSELWKQRTGAIQEPTVGMGIYKLTRVIPPTNVSGQLRLAHPEEQDLIGAWFEQFAKHIGEPRTDDARKIAAERIAAERLFVWTNPEPVSMAAWAGPTPNGVRINLVFTPPEHRRRGYASACVAALSQRMLDSGKKFCFLYTDLANPTSNKIYQNIGYQHVRDDSRIFFKPANA